MSQFRLSFYSAREEDTFKTRITAKNQAEAEQLARLEIRDTYLEEYALSDEALVELDRDWILVDCFDLDDFVKENTKTLSPDELRAAEEDWPVDSWKRAVALDATNLGYNDWIKERKACSKN